LTVCTNKDPINEVKRKVSDNLHIDLSGYYLNSELEHMLVSLPRRPYTEMSRNFYDKVVQCLVCDLLIKIDNLKEELSYDSY